MNLTLARPRQIGAPVLVLLAALAALILPATAAAAPPPLTVTPDPVSVPTTTVGLSSGTIEVELRNDDRDPVKIEAINLDGEDAREYGLQGSNCGTLNEGEKCQVWFWFAPTSEGTKVATLSVSAYERPTLEIALKGAAVPAKLAWSPEGEDFGLQRVNRGAERYFQLENRGEAPVYFNGLQIVGPDSGSFWTSDSSCWAFPGNQIGPGQSCWVRVNFQPYETRSYEAQLVATAGGFEFSASLRGEGGQAELVPGSNPVGFGAAGVGSGELRTITLTNQGNLPGAYFIAIVAGGDAGSFELVDENCSGFEPVEPAASCSVRIRFKPQSPGVKQARLALFGEDDGGTMIMLEGEGVASQVALSLADVTFGAQEAGTRSAARTVLVSNDGTTAATVDRVVLAGADPDQFLIAGEECGEEVLAPGESCAVRVRFAPDSAGPKSARLKVSGGFGTLAATLAGAGRAATPATSASPDVHPPTYQPAPAAKPHRRTFARNATIRGPKRVKAKARAVKLGKRAGKRAVARGVRR